MSLLPDDMEASSSFQGTVLTEYLIPLCWLLAHDFLFSDIESSSSALCLRVMQCCEYVASIDYRFSEFIYSGNLLYNDFSFEYFPCLIKYRNPF